MAIENFQGTKDTLVSSVYYRAHHVGPGNVFKIKFLKRLKNAILNLVFANNKSILLNL